MPSMDLALLSAISMHNDPWPQPKSKIDLFLRSGLPPNLFQNLMFSIFP